MKQGDHVVVNNKHIDQIVKIDPMTITLKKCNATFRKNLLKNNNSYYANHSNIELSITPAPNFFNKK